MHQTGRGGRTRRPAALTFWACASQDPRNGEASICCRKKKWCGLPNVRAARSDLARPSSPLQVREGLAGLTKRQARRPVGAASAGWAASAVESWQEDEERSRKRDPGHRMADGPSIGTQLGPWLVRGEGSLAASGRHRAEDLEIREALQSLAPALEGQAAPARPRHPASAETSRASRCRIDGVPRCEQTGSSSLSLRGDGIVRLVRVQVTSASAQGSDDSARPGRLARGLYQRRARGRDCQQKADEGGAATRRRR